MVAGGDSLVLPAMARDGDTPPGRTPWWDIGVTYESPICKQCDDTKSDSPVGVHDRCPVCRCSWRTNTKRALSSWAYCTHGLMVLDRARQPPPPCDDKKEKSEIEENKLASAGGWLVDRVAEWIGRGCGRLVEWTGRACSLATRLCHKVQPPNKVLKKCNAEFKVKVWSQPEEFDAPLCLKTAMLKKWTGFMQG